MTYRQPTQGDLIELAKQKADKYGLDKAAFIALIDSEAAKDSHGNWIVNGDNPQGYKGLGQLGKDVIRDYAVSDPHDPDQNLDAAARLLKAFLKRPSVNGDYDKAVYKYKGLELARSEARAEELITPWRRKYQAAKESGKYDGINTTLGKGTHPRATDTYNVEGGGVDTGIMGNSAAGALADVGNEISGAPSDEEEGMGILDFLGKLVSEPSFGVIILLVMILSIFAAYQLMNNNNLDVGALSA